MDEARVAFTAVWASVPLPLDTEVLLSAECRDCAAPSCAFAAAPQGLLEKLNEGTNAALARFTRLLPPGYADAAASRRELQQWLDKTQRERRSANEQASHDCCRAACLAAFDAHAKELEQRAVAGRLVQDAGTDPDAQLEETRRVVLEAAQACERARRGYFDGAVGPCAVPSFLDVLDPALSKLLSGVADSLGKLAKQRQVEAQAAQSAAASALDAMRGMLAVCVCVLRRWRVYVWQAPHCEPLCVSGSRSSPRLAGAVAN